MVLAMIFRALCFVLYEFDAREISSMEVSYFQKKKKKGG